MDHHPVFALIEPSVLNTQTLTLLIFLLIILFFISFVVSGAEVAFFSLSFKEINLLKTKQQAGYKRIVDLLETPRNLQASLFVANTLVNIAIVILLNFVIDLAFVINNSFWWTALILKILVVTFLLVLFGQIMPKVMATQNKVRFAKDSGPLVQVLSYLFKGLGSGLLSIADLIENKFARRSNAAYSLDELDSEVVLNTEASKKEKNILKGIVKFSNITARQVMKGRLDVSGIEYNTNFSALVKKVEELHYSRLPVFKEDLDQVVGIIHTKDLLPHLEQDENFDWHNIMRPPFFIHEQKMIEDLLQEFQTKRVHFAIVVDEFGGTSGIVTLEDILEEIIGDIRDEFDEDDIAHIKVDDYNYIFEGKIMIHDVCRLMELPLETFDEVRGESESLAGLVLELSGNIPKAEAVITSGDFEFTVLEVDKNRLQKIKVTIKPRQKT